MARPKRANPEVNRTERLVVRLNPEEKKFIFQLAADQKTSAADYVRAVFFDPDTRQSLGHAKYQAMVKQVAEMIKESEETDDKSET